MQVTVYGRHSCQPCRATVRRLMDRDIDHRFVDVATLTDDDVHQLALRTAGHGLPWVVAEDQSWAGYRPDRIDALAGAR